jgi:hypothetical protein
MATRNVSPGGALLRASRLFSIPAPLPRPIGERSSTATFNSDTATLPYPTHLTITTPPSSLSKGDWGLKRPLPLRSTTKTSTPLLRVESVDTIEHITEYGSAADHTLTLQKWQEMNMPLSTPVAKDSSLGYMGNHRKPGRGVFEEDLGTSSEGVLESATDETRWRFQGPWLAGLTDGEFNGFVRKTIRSRKSDFQFFLRETKALEDTKTAQRKAAEQGQNPPPAIKSSDITAKQLRMYIKELRQDRAALFRLIRMFLDLPPTPSPKGFLGEAIDDMIHSIGTDTGSKPLTINSEDFLPKSNSPYAETGPPKTHPSAGLSYLRTSRYMYNHPVYGPQEHPPPIQGRIVIPKNANVGSFAAKLGIAGVVTEAPLGESFNTSDSSSSRARHAKSRKQTHPGLLNIEPDKVGGSKVYLRPATASIDPSGRIDLRVDSGDGPALAILLGKENMIQPKSSQQMRPIKPLPRPPNITQQGYGLESRDTSSDQMRAAGDERDNRSSSNPNPSKRPVDENEAMRAFTNLLDRADHGY